MDNTEPSGIVVASNFPASLSIGPSGLSRYTSPSIGTPFLHTSARLAIPGKFQRKKHGDLQTSAAANLFQKNKRSTAYY